MASLAGSKVHLHYLLSLWERDRKSHERLFTLYKFDINHV
ncbi:hypothetical protein XBP1_560004 [Xenorhabdus bovienii str. puntauvense]|uniref:Uncharacterized protein n=1 Tax=Xenorhabdus bovienii str. puntauvense TaxID=1398201 RepID=A0A077NM45_XENBV|nr:hypothetical protein XBP1_560004 [Xenorhabdus bovienii str. puntauvense]